MTATRGKGLEETTEGVDAGAASSEQEGWHAIKWYQAHQNVRRLQARIVKATQDKRWGRVQALQRLLTHSYSGKVLAVKRVTENQGKRTPGVDGQLWNTPGKKAHATQTLQQRGYRPGRSGASTFRKAMARSVLSVCRR
jgi:RNA-directed DNA polymerase